jgi:peptide/nickel transport system permease protein
MNSDYIRTAHAKGLKNLNVVMKHVLRNAAIPVLTMIGLRFGVLMGGAVITEVVFNWPGLGTLTVEAVRGRDVGLVQACLIVISVFVVLSSLVVDLLYSLVDPRITYS